MTFEEYQSDNDLSFWEIFEIMRDYIGVEPFGIEVAQWFDRDVMLECLADIWNTYDLGELI